MVTQKLYTQTMMIAWFENKQGKTFANAQTLEPFTQKAM